MNLLFFTCWRNKSTQQADIDKAVNYLEDYHVRMKMTNKIDVVKENCFCISDHDLEMINELREDPDSNT